MRQRLPEPSHTRAMGLIDRYSAELQWSREHQVPYAFFPRGGTWEWIFLEDARSFRAKLGLVDEYGLRGLSVWVLGPGDPGIWTVLRERGETAGNEGSPTAATASGNRK